MILCLQTGYIRGKGALGKLQQQSLYTVQLSTEAFDDLSHRSNGISGHHIRVKLTTDFRLRKIIGRPSSPKPCRWLMMSTTMMTTTMMMMMMTAWEDVASTAPCPALSTQTVATLSTTDADHEQDCLDECSAKQLKSAKERIKNRIIVTYHQAGKQNLWEFCPKPILALRYPRISRTARTLENCGQKLWWIGLTVFGAGQRAAKLGNSKEFHQFRSRCRAYPPLFINNPVNAIFGLLLEPKNFCCRAYIQQEVCVRRMIQMICKEVKKSTNLFAAPVSGDSRTIQLDLEPVDNPSFASLKAGTLVSQRPLTAPRASHNFSTPLSSGGDRVSQPPSKSQLTHQSGDSITLPLRPSVDFQAPGQ